MTAIDQIVLLFYVTAMSFFPDSTLCGNNELEDNNPVAVALALVPLVTNKWRQGNTGT